MVEVTCPDCGFKRNAELRNRGLVRVCLSCKIKRVRKDKFWVATGIGHKESRTPLYRVWNAMKQRCDVHTSDVYNDYGGRGISYCELWKEFVPFRDWAMANGYKRGLLLDRINNDGNYSPENCRWATPMQSSMNRRNNAGQSVADVAVMKSLYELGVANGLIAALYGISIGRFSNIREKRLWGRMDILNYPLEG